MAVFRFPYEVLLDVRRRAERDRQIEMAALQQERAALEGRISSIQGTISATKNELRDALSGLGEARELRLHAGNVLHLQASAQHLAIQLAGVHARIERARVALVSATGARRAVEQMRERQLARWRIDLDRRENAEMDDLALMRRTGMKGRRL